MAFRCSLLAAAVSFAAATTFSGAASAQFNSIIVFGDSLSDGGTYGAKFTTNPANVWVELLAARLGLTLKPWTQGGLNYAQGGQRVALSPGITPEGAPDRPVAAQITQHLAANGGKIAPGALVTLWAGANDFFVGFDAFGRGQLTAEQLQAAITKAGQDLVVQVARLRAAGAQTILVVNLPDIGSTPSGAAAGPARASLTALSGLYNTIVNEGLKQVGGNVIAINSFGLVNEVIANPALYGFTNVTTPACTTASAIQCTPATLRAPNADKTWLFADSVHPTAAGHAALEGVVAATIMAPAAMSLLPEAALNGSRAQGRALDARQRMAGSSGHGVFVTLDAGRAEVANGVDMNASSLVIGADRKFGNLTAGMAFGYHKSEGDLFGAGSFDLGQPMVSAFAGASLGSGYVNAAVSLGDLRYRDITRLIAIGTATRAEVSRATGAQQLLSLGGGAWLGTGAWNHGPFARLDFSKVTVKAFAESGTSSSAMSFSKQRRTQLLGALGYQVQGTMGGFSPFARIAYERDFEANPSVVRARTVSMAGSEFTLPGAKPNEKQVLAEAGVTARMGRAEVGLSLQGGFARDEGDYFAGNLSVRVPF
jgi:outer membrane lipase/esterase